MEYVVYTHTHPHDVYETTSIWAAYEHAQELVEDGHEPVIERYGASVAIYSWTSFHALVHGDR